MNLKKKYVILRRKCEKKTNKWFGALRQKRLNDSNFTIISNNCWGGLVSQYFDMPYLSPTVGLYIYPEDYLILLENLKYFLRPSAELRFISIDESKHAEDLRRKQQFVPIGLLDGVVEIVFLHYTSTEDAAEKWFRRAERVNWNHLIIKFSQMNGCTQEHLEKFEKLSFKNKFCLVANKEIDLPSCIYYPGYEKERQIANDTDFLFRGLNIYEIINGKL